MFSFNDAVVVVTSENGVSATLPVEPIDGKRFFHLVKSNYGIRKLLESSCDDSLRAKAHGSLMAHTTIIEQITELRDAAFEQRLTDMCTKHQRYKTKRYTAKEQRTSIHQLPVHAELAVPGYGDIAGISMHVKLSKPRSPLYVELTEANLSFITKVVASQAHDGKTVSSPKENVCDDDRETVDIRGVTCSYVRRAYRATHKDHGETRTKFCKWDVYGKSKALEVAAEFHVNGVVTEDGGRDGD